MGLERYACRILLLAHLHLKQLVMIHCLRPTKESRYVSILATMLLRLEPAVTACPSDWRSRSGQTLYPTPVPKSCFLSLLSPR